MAGIDTARVTDCPVCLGTFKDPRFLPCGHTFCLGCITEYGRSKGSDPDCPNCRRKFQIPSNGYESLPKNYSLNSVLHDSVRVVGVSKAKVTKGLCKKHSGEELIIYCMQCNMLICLHCVEKDHRTHDWSRISIFAKEARTQLKGYVKGIKPILSEVTSQKAQLQEKSKKFCDLLDETELAIKEEYEKNKRLLDDHRRLLLEELSNEKQRVTKDLKMSTEEIQTEQLRLATFNTRVEEMLLGTDEATTFDIVCQYKDFKDSFDKLKQTQPQAMGQVSVTGIGFLPGDFKDFSSRRGNIIGRLQRESDSRPTVERNRLLRRELTPNIKQVDHFLMQRVPIDQHVWYYLERKHPDRVNCIAGQHLCISRVVCESSNEGIAHRLEVAPYAQADSDEAKKCVDDAVEEFAQLYQKVSEPGIIKESFKLPLALNQGMPQRLIAELEEMGVFFLNSDDPCLIGPKACIEEAKLKVSDFISGQKNSQARSADNFGLARASATDHVQPMTFKTPSGLTVHVSKGDLVHQSLDAIVNPANENLGNEGGAARAIAKAAGYDLQRECNEYIRREGKLGITHVMHTSAGNLRPKIKYVIHTVGPTKSDAKDDEELLALVRLAIFNCINYANEHLKIQSLAIPAISSGIFGVPIEIVGRASFEALTKFDEYCALSKNTVREIYFLNKDEPTFSNMKRIFQYLRTHASSIDPEQPVHGMEILDQYADVCGRQRIETTPDDNCFARAFATALQIDFQSKLDWSKVDEVIRKELKNNKDYYTMFNTKEEPGRQWSWTYVVKNPFDVFDALVNRLSPMNGDKDYHPDIWINAAANALKVQIVLVQLSEKQEAVERNFKPRLSESDDTVYIFYQWRGHHHFDALVKKDNVTGKRMATGTEGASSETKNKWSPSEHSYTNKNWEDFFEKLDKSDLYDMPREKAPGVAGKNALTEKASDEAGKKAGDDKKDDDDDDNHCIICMDNITDKKELPCKHKFCRECIDDYFSKCQPKCPICGKVFGMLKGDQPKGTMTSRENSRQRLAGYKDCATIEIEYSFNDGIQGASHPNPGQPYKGMHQTAYLPANREGREVLRLLKRAFDAGLVFTIGWSNVVISNDVSHKTSPTGQDGYPDPTYMKRVREELAGKGIQ